jgi:glycosyltransferase involved in cell wall biosynthesis
MKINKTYLVKNLTLWMLDEIEALNDLVDFKLVLLRRPNNKSIERLKQLRKKGLTIIEQPFKKSLLLGNFILLLKLFFIYIFKNNNKKNLIFTIKAIYWYSIFDKNLISSNEKIHAQFATQASIIAFLLKQHFSNNIEYTFTIHAYDIFYNNAWLNTLVDHSHKCFSISNYNIYYLKNKYQLNSEKLQLSRLGVFRPNLNIGKKTDSNNTLIIGFLSWFEKKKGIFYLLDALHHAKKDDLNVKLLLAGDGKLKQEIKQYITDKNLESYVDIVGPVFGKQKELFFRKLDLFIMPSIKIPNDMDGIPVVLMEAISYAIPIISTKLSGIPEICKDQENGYLVSQKDTEEIYNRIKYLYNNRDVLENLKKEALRVSKEYDIRINTKKKAKELNWI